MKRLRLNDQTLITILKICMIIQISSKSGHRRLTDEGPHT